MGSSHEISKTDNPTDEEVNQDVLETLEGVGKRYKLAVTILGLIVLWALIAWGYQIIVGMGVTGKRRPNLWALYITTFVFWIGISHGGTMISAILRLAKAEWRRPITRGAEALTVFALAIAILFPMIHMGRVWLFYWMMPVPNRFALWPNFRSPLSWDLFAMTTYLMGSVVFFYVALIPDLAIVRDHMKGLRAKLCGVLSLGWRGTAREWRWLEMAGLTMAIIIIPLAVSVHTIVGWDFGMTLTPGWHSTIFAPYFVLGAIFSGLGAVVIAMSIVRWVFGLQKYLTPHHFNQLGKVLLTVSLLWGYFFFAEALTVWYGHDPAEMSILQARTTGKFMYFFITMIFCNFIIPVSYLSFPKLRRNIKGFFVVGLFINVGMYIERFLIVVPSLTYSRLPFIWRTYTPGWVEISILAGSLAGYILLYLLFVKTFPVIPIWEVKEGLLASTSKQIGDATLPAIMKHD